MSVEKCRLCLRSDFEKSMSLFEPYKSSFVHDYVMSIANVEIRQEDGYPDKICPTCLLELETALLFKNKCESSDVILKQSASDVAEFTVGCGLLIKKEEDDGEIDIDNIFLENLSNYDMGEDGDKKPDIKNNDVLPMCHDCKQTFKSKCKLRVHWKKEHKPKSFTCPTCKRLFKNVISYDKHMQTFQKSCTDISNNSGIHIEGEGKNRMFCCRFCTYTTNRMIHMRAHLVVHTGSKPFKCDLCAKAYTQRGPLKVHKELVHSEKRASAECHVCGKLMLTKKHLLRHLQIHSDQKHKCPVCDMSLKSKASLRVHMMRHNGEKNYTCELCAATFFTMAELCNHRKTHLAKERLFKCDMCDYRATRKTQIIKHSQKHSEDKPFPCEMCGRFFESLQNLKIHEKRHLAEKRFSCPMCPKLFCRKRSVSKHLQRAHDTKVPYTNILDVSHVDF